MAECATRVNPIVAMSYEHPGSEIELPPRLSAPLMANSSANQNS